MARFPATAKVYVCGLQIIPNKNATTDVIAFLHQKPIYEKTS